MNHRHSTLLTAAEQKQFSAAPTLTDDERQWCFTLSDAEQAVCDQFSDVFSQAHFVLLLGYFKVKKMRLVLTWGQTRHDLEYIYSRCFPTAPRPRQSLGKMARSRIYRSIFKLTDYSLYTASWRDKLTDNLNAVTLKCMNRRFAFDECMLWLEQHLVEIPAYTTLDKLISLTLQRIEDALLDRVRGATNTTELNLLLALLDKADDHYGITALKKPIKDFSFGQTAIAIKQSQTLRQFYPQAKRLIEATGLSPLNVRQLATIPQQYSANQLKQFKPVKSALYLLCYIYHQHQTVSDHLVQAYRKLVRHFQDLAQDHIKARRHADAEVVAQRVKPMAGLLNLFVDTTVNGTTPFSMIKQMAFQYVPEQDIPVIVRYFEGIELEPHVYAWEYYDAQMATIVRNLRSLFLAIEFTARDDQPLLKMQLTRAQTLLATAPDQFILDRRFVDNADQSYVLLSDVKQKLKQSHRCEWYLYQKLDKQLEPNNVFVSESLQFKALDAYLVPHHAVNAASCARLRVPASPREAADHLATLQSELTKKMQSVSERIGGHDNRFVRVIEDGKQLKRSRPFKAKERSFESLFTDTQHPESIIQLMRWVDQETKFGSLFRHARSETQHASFNFDNLVACLIANGTNAGVFKLSKISDRVHHVLQQTESSYLTRESLHAANDCLVNLISALPIYANYRNSQGQLHASADGQKFGTQWRSSLARYSPKYFGMEPGISILSLIAGHLPLRSKVISANDHESHHLYDLLFNQSTDVSLDRVSTDQHGVNAFNFAILYAFGYRFAPRYAKFKRRFEQHFKIDYEASDKQLLRAKKEIDWALIRQEWDNLIRILVSLDNKHTSQALLIKKLASYKQYNQTLKALSEYNRAIQLLYLLDYVDDEALRQHVQGALNIGESFHQMSRSIATMNGRDTVKGRSELDFTVWNESAKLIANCILYYNAFILSALLDHYRSSGNETALRRVINTSPAAWAHINLSGYFQFASNDDRYQIEQVIDALKRVA